jgi:hypothetical protein
MSELSPAAQAVFWEFNSKFDWIEDGVPEPQYKAIAAALRAAAEQVVPEEPLYEGDQRWMLERDARQACRKKLLAIADELETK